MNSRDHPRVCGEKRRGFFAHSVVAGSPPRVRGKVKSVIGSPFSSGITPACAGKSKTWGAFKRCCEDHPRVCGEKSLSARPWRLHGGSPPRVRGKVVGRSPQTPTTRITPACAGKRLKKARRYAIFSFEQHTIPLVSHKAAAPICSPPPPCGREN